MKNDYPVRTLCDNLEVSTSGFYDWQQRRSSPGPRTAQNQALTLEIHKIHARSRQTYGSPRILMELRKDGRHHGRNRISRLMREQGLCGRQKRRYRLKPGQGKELRDGRRQTDALPNLGARTDVRPSRWPG